MFFEFHGWLHSLLAVILETKKRKSVTVSTFSPSVCPKVMGLDAMILVFSLPRPGIKPMFPTLEGRSFFFLTLYLFIYSYNSGNRRDMFFHTFYLLRLERFPPHSIFFYTSTFDSRQGFHHPGVGGFIWFLSNWCMLRMSPAPCHMHQCFEYPCTHPQCLHSINF